MTTLTETQLAPPPSIETVAGIYRAAIDQEQRSALFTARIRALIVKHGYTEDEVVRVARNTANASTPGPVVRPLRELCTAISL